MTTSAYDVIKYTDLNEYMGVTLVNIDSAYTQAVIDSWISQAEQIVATIIGKKPSSDDDFSVYAVKMLAERIAWDNIIKKGNTNVAVKQGTLQNVIKDVLDLWELTNKIKKTDSGIDIYNYNGNDIDYYYY
jgi:hypothetical protein